jgi:hypothetical protein
MRGVGSSKTYLPNYPVAQPKMQVILCLPVVEVKGKAIPLQTWTDPEGSRRLRIPDFKTIGT